MSIENGRMDKLDPKVLIPFLILGILEFELFTFARSTIEAAEQDAWLSVLLGTVTVSFFVYLLIRLAARFPKENLFQYSGKVWGKPLGVMITLGYLLFWAVYLSTLLEDAIMANKILFLPKTPSIIPMVLVAVGAIWLVAYGLTAVVRFFQLNLAFLLLPLLLLGALSLRNIRTENFFPILSNGIGPVVQGTLTYMGAHQGIESILFLAPFITNIRSSVKPALIGIIVVSFMAFLQVTSAIGIMGVENVRHSIWPGIDTISLIDLPGFPVERFELLLTLPWLIAVFTTLCLYLYLLSFGLVQFFNLRHRKAAIYAVALTVFGATMLFPNYAWTIVFRQYLSWAGLVFIFLIPTLTLAVACIRGRRGSR